MISNSLPKEVFVITERLQKKMSAECIFLFGSAARGDAGPDSDLDFLVVIPQSDASRYQRAVVARCAIGKIGIPLDVVVLTREEWEREKKVPCSLSSTALREGICLHE